GQQRSAHLRASREQAGRHPLLLRALSREIAPARLRLLRIAHPALPAQSGGAEGTGTSVNGLPNVLRRRRDLVLVGVAGGGVARVLLFLLPPRHRASSLGGARPERGRPGETRPPSPASAPPAPPTVRAAVATVPQPPVPDSAGRIRVPL